MGDIYHAGSTYAGSVPIDDTQATATNTWSAQKINNEINELSDTSNAILNDVGAKNLLPNKATSQTVSGVTFTVNSDGTIRAVGTATSAILFDISIKPTLADGTYILSGCPQGGSQDTYYLHYTNAVDTAFSDYGNGVEFTPFDYTQNPNAKVRLCIKPAAGAVNLLFKPMIRPVSIADDTYVPYAMTNRELTQSTSKLTQSAVRVVIYDPITVNCAVGNNYANIPNLDVVNLFGVIVTGVTAGYSYETINNIVFVPSTNKLAISVTRAQNVTVKCASLHLF